MRGWAGRRPVRKLGQRGWAGDRRPTRLAALPSEQTSATPAEPRPTRQRSRSARPARPTSLEPGRAPARPGCRQRARAPGVAHDPRSKELVAPRPESRARRRRLLCAQAVGSERKERGEMKGRARTDQRRAWDCGQAAGGGGGRVGWVSGRDDELGCGFGGTQGRFGWGGAGARLGERRPRTRPRGSARSGRPRTLGQPRAGRAGRARRVETTSTSTSDVQPRSSLAPLDACLRQRSTSRSWPRSRRASPSADLDPRSWRTLCCTVVGHPRRILDPPPG